MTSEKVYPANEAKKLRERARREEESQQTRALADIRGVLPYPERTLQTSIMTES